jgi:hypothetical protein
MSNEQLAKPTDSSKRLTASGQQWFFILIFILLLATFFRFYQLFHLPPGLNFDEAGNGVAALDILHGNPKIWWQIGGGKEPLWPYLIALSTTLLDNIPFALRFPAALAGILTVAVLYPLTVVMFRNRLVAIYAMLGLALSAWHLHFSRLGFRAILLPLLSSLAFYFLWLGLKKLRNTQYATHTKFFIPNFVLSALFTSLAIYSYLAARLLPLVIILFLCLDWLISRFHLQKVKSLSNQSIPNLLSPISNLQLLIRFLAYLLIFLSPLIIYFLFNPADFVARAGTVSIFNSTDIFGTGWRTLTLTLGTFLGINGDANPLVNLPSQPALPYFLVPFFIIGLGASIYHAIRSYASRITHHAPNPYLFLLCWWAIMLLPALLAPEGAPHHLRLIGTIIPTYIFVAVGFSITIKFLTRLLSHSSFISHPLRGKNSSLIATLLPATCFLLLALHTYTNYFIRWPANNDFTLPFDLYATRLAADIANKPPDTTYILPMDIRAAAEARHYTLDYLINNEQLAISNSINSLNSSNLLYIPVDEHNAETLLTQAGQNADELRIVRWTDDKHHEADAKEIITFLLETNAALTNRESFPVYDVETYQLLNNCKNKEREDCTPHAPEFALPKIDRPVLANLDNLLQINAAFVQPAVLPGDMLSVAMTLAPLNPMDADYKASIRLISPSGERLLQKDRTLMHNFHQGTSLWPPETVNEYYLLPISPDTPPGNYSVVAVIYHPDTLAPLVADGAVEIPLGSTQIE